MGACISGSYTGNPKTSGIGVTLMCDRCGTRVRVPVRENEYPIDMGYLARRWGWKRMYPGRLWCPDCWRRL